MTTARGVVSGHYAGVFTRFLAFVIDMAFVLFMYGVIATGVRLAVDMFLGVERAETSGEPVLWSVGLALWALVYLATALTITGRTIGKGLLGLKVVTREGGPLGARQALVRVVTFPLSVIPAGLGFVGVLVGRERRALHDVLAGSAVVYDWGDRPAEMPAPLSRWLTRKGVADPKETFGDLVAWEDPAQASESE